MSLGVGELAGTSYSLRHSEEIQSLMCPFFFCMSVLSFFISYSLWTSFLSFSLHMSENGYRLYYFALPTS